MQSTQNPYSKLEEALRVFLNPTLDLVTSVDIKDLKNHCYYLIKHYPKHEHPLWDHLINREWGQLTDPIFLSQLDEGLSSNIQLAAKNQDENYLQFLLDHQPHRKITLNLMRKKAIISDSISSAMGIDNSKTLTSVALKKKMNQYIFTERLQEQGLIKVNTILSEVLAQPELEGKMVHVFEIHRQFNQKYLA